MSMTAHELAKLLLEGPDLPVVINGWGSDEGLGPFVVSGVFTEWPGVVGLDHDEEVYDHNTGKTEARRIKKDLDQEEKGP